jgi:malate dehydrogenase
MDVAIIGAGELGSALAHRLAARDRVRRVRLIDELAGRAAGTALDIAQAAPISSSSTSITHGSDMADAIGCHAVVFADRADASRSPGREDTDLATLRRAVDLVADAVFVFGRAEQRALIERGVNELHVRPGRLIGSAPLALASAVRALVALEADAAPADVSLTLAGIPPARAVVSWTAATIAGTPVEALLTPPQIARLDARIGYLWPPGPHALASAAAEVCEALSTGGHRAFPCFVWVDGEFGARRQVVALPVRVGPSGLASIARLHLSPGERIRLENAIAGLRADRPAQ